MVCLPFLLVFLIRNPSAFAQRSAEDLYRSAEKNLTQLEQSTEKEKFRSQWERAIHGFLMVADRYPKSSLADDALYKAGMVTLKLRNISRSSRDTDSAIRILERLAGKYPQSRYADDAQYMIGEVYRTIKNSPEEAYAAYAEIPKRFPRGDMVREARERLSELPAPDLKKAEEPGAANGSVTSNASSDGPAPSDILKSSGTGEVSQAPRSEESSSVTETAEIQETPQAPGTPETSEIPETENNVPAQTAGKPAGGAVHVLGIRQWAGSDYVRVVIDLDGPVRYKQQQLSGPDRVFVDIENARLSRELRKESIQVSKGYLRSIRVGQFDKQTSRVVLDLEKIRNVSVFYLSDPDRIVMDVAGDESTTERLTRIRYKVKQGGSGTLTLSEQLGMKVARVVLDPGHGGKDPGCIGKSGLTEKEITLDVARRLKKLLEENLNLQVIMTRNRDVFIPLDERTAIANREKADLFISIHVNAAEDPSLSGVETWFLDLAASERAKKIAARENLYFQKPRSDLDKILNDLLLNSKTQESSRLAGILQDDLTSGLNRKFKDIQSHGVKGAPFVVLVGARMPSVLSEISFMSNPTEERRLKSIGYRNDIAKSLFDGISRYVCSPEYAFSLGSPRNPLE